MKGNDRRVFSYFKEPRLHAGHPEEILRSDTASGKRDGFYKARSGRRLQAGFSCQKQAFDTARRSSLRPFQRQGNVSIHSLSGQVLGFGGRVLKTDAKTAIPQTLPSRRSTIRAASSIGIYQARKAITAIR